MNNAEMRARLTLIGLSLKQLATITGWDYRDLRREANGNREISERTADMIEGLEAAAERDLTYMHALADAGRPIALPHFSDPGTSPYLNEGTTLEGMPGSYYHALAGAVLATSDGASLTYRDSSEPR